MAHANPIQIQKYLKGVDYPANKAELIEKAREMGADESICASLEQLPDEDFQTPAEVSQAFSGPSEDHAERSSREPGRRSRAAVADDADDADEKDTSGSREFLAQAMGESMAEIELCMVALKQSTDKDVHQFARAMIDEHGKMGDDMEKLAKKKKIDVPSGPGKDHLAILNKLSKLQGDQFDQRFIEQNLRDHETSLKVFRHYASDAPDHDIKALAAHGEKMLARHLKMIKDLDRKLQK